MSENDDTKRADQTTGEYYGERKNKLKIGSKDTKTYTFEINPKDQKYKAYDPENTAHYAKNDGLSQKVTVTPSGHQIEIDDSKNGERLKIRHMSGTYAEMHHDGKMQVTTEDDLYITSRGGCNIKMTGGDFVVWVTDGQLNIRADGDANIQTDNINITTKNVKWDASGSFEINATGDMTLKASKIDLNP